MPASPDAPWEAWPLERKGVLKGDPEAIHRLRVAANRLRAACLLSGSPASSSLLKLTRALGRVRAWDRHRALLMTLPCVPDAWPGRAREVALTRIAQKRRLAMKALRRRLRSSPLHRCDPPPMPPPSGYREGLDALAQGEQVGIDALHDLRRALRALRYALEWRSPGDPSIEPLKRLAWTLGLHRDWLLCEAFLARRAERWARRGRIRLAAGAQTLREDAALRRHALEASLPPLAEAFLEAHRADEEPGA